MPQIYEPTAIKFRKFGARAIVGLKLSSRREDMMGGWWRGSIAPYILHFLIKWTSIVSITIGPLFPHRNGPSGTHFITFDNGKYPHNFPRKSLAHDSSF